MPYPISELFAWVVDDPSGRHGILGVMGPDGLPMQAVSSRRELMDGPHFRAVAEHLAKVTELPIHLKRFVLAETVSTIPQDN